MPLDQSPTIRPLDRRGGPPPRRTNFPRVMERIHSSLRSCRRKACACDSRLGDQTFNRPVDYQLDRWILNPEKAGQHRSGRPFRGLVECRHATLRRSCPKGRAGADSAAATNFRVWWNTRHDSLKACCSKERTRGIRVTRTIFSCLFRAWWNTRHDRLKPCCSKERARGTRAARTTFAV